MKARLVKLIFFAFAAVLTAGVAAQNIRVFPRLGHTGRVTSAAFSPDGRNIVSASWDGTVKVWDYE